MSFRLQRSHVAVALVAALMLLAGCSSPGGSGSGDTADTEEEATTEALTGANETAETNGTAETNRTAEMNGTTDGEMTDDGESDLSGRMLVVIEGKDTHLDADSDAKFSFNETNEHTWKAEEPMSLAEALETANVTATSDSLTIDGETYNASDENTTITYRVAGTEIEDPSDYELEDLNPAHDIVVRVDTHDQETPGRLVDQSHPHPHGQLDVIVDGEQVDLSQDKYVMTSEAFHFHGDENASRWHAHALNITPAYALSTFPETNVSEGSMTFEGDVYSRNDSDTSFNLTVNGEAVDPHTYVLKDGDDIEVTLNDTAEVENVG